MHQVINRSTDGVIRILSLSYGKDSLACLGAIEQLGLPLDGIVHAEVWFNDTIPADLPPMVEFKQKADEIIKQRYGFEVKHICAMQKCSQTGNVERERESYSTMFYRKTAKGKFIGTTKGFPMQRGGWCRKLKLNALSETDILRYFLPRNSKTENEEEGFAGGRFTASQEKINGQWCSGKLKQTALDCVRISVSPRSGMVPRTQEYTDSRSGAGTGVKAPSSRTDFSQIADDGRGKNTVIQYLGIAADEPERIKRHSVPGKELPLVEIGWDEATCRKWCEDNDLLSPTYTTATRGGCWFCHNQGVNQLRLLRKNYPNLWAELMKLDLDSPVTFHSDGHTVHDFDKRFQLEDDGQINAEDRFRWDMLNGGFELLKINFEELNDGIL